MGTAGDSYRTTPVRIGLLGAGTVGGGTYEVLTRNHEEITRRVGRPLAITRVADLDLDLARSVTGGAVDVVDDAFAVVRDPEIANKALLATHGNEIFAAAQEMGVMVAFEAAVAGGIPIIKALREGLVANRIAWIAGIINGTTNFILSEMRSRGVDFATALADAQARGYAEADPTFDIEGVDAAHKLSLMAAMAFGIPVRFDDAYIEGVTAVEQIDIRYAEEMGYRLKLLGITRRRDDGIELRVHPALVPVAQPIANVEGVMNAVLVMGDAVGPTLYSGAGAGAQPTASAVIADLVDVARLITADPEHRVPHLAFQPDQVTDTPILSMDDVRTSYYLRLRVADEPGVLADITRILADEGISIDAALQKEPSAEDQAVVVLLTHETEERSVKTAIGKIEALAATTGSAVMLRVEKLT
jgi:homoserine dehydrogenase